MEEMGHADIFVCTQRYLHSLHCTLAMNKLRSITTTAEYT